MRYKMENVCHYSDYKVHSQCNDSFLPPFLNESKNPGLTQKVLHRVLHVEEGCYVQIWGFVDM